MSPTPRIESFTTAAEVEPHEIGAALTALWRRAEEAEQAEGGGTVLRACGLTLIAMVSGEKDLASVTAEIGYATTCVPARTLVVELDADTARGLDVDVAAFCTLDGPGHRQVCREQVLLRARADRHADVAPLVTPQLVADLPVVLLVPDGRLLDEGAARMVMPVADLVLTDSARGGRPKEALTRLVELQVHRGRAVRDFAFERLFGLRAALAAACDEALRAGRQLAAVEIGAPEESTAGLLLAAHVEARLANLPASAVLRHGPKDGLEVVLRFDGGLERRFRYVEHRAPADAGHGEEPCDDVFRAPPDGDVLARVLADPRRSRSFAEALEHATRLLLGKSSS